MDNKSLYDKILEASNIIARKARSGSGNYILLTSSQIGMSLWNIYFSRSQKRKEKIKKIYEN